MSTRLIALLSVFLLPGASGVPDAQHRTVVAAAPTCPPVSLVRAGTQSSGLDARNNRGTWKLKRAIWDENAPDPIEYPIRSDAWTKGCIRGGTVNGDVPKSWTRDQWYDAEDGGTRLGGDAFRQTLTLTPGNFLRIKNSYVEDYEDAYNPKSPSTSYAAFLEHVRAKYIRDDCIENEDVPITMVVRDSLFDGCFTAFAERPHGSTTARDGSGPQTFKVVKSLVYVRPQPLGPNYCDDAKVSLGRCRATILPNVWRGSYGIWKWSDQAASRVIVRNTVFRLDMASYSSCQSQMWPHGTYKNVTLVWLGQGRYRTAGGCTNRLPHGVRLSRDVHVWRAAKAAWFQR